VPLYSQAAYPFSQGAGLVLGLGAGGYIRGGDKYVGLFGGILKDNAYPSPLVGSLTVDPRSRPAWEIFVNAHGERFFQEDHPSADHREHALNRQPGRRFWAVFDQAIFDHAPPVIPAWSREKFAGEFNQGPMFSRATSLGELGVRAGINPRALKQSVAEYNDALTRGSPDRLGRTHRPLPIIEPPFYAIRAQGWTLWSFAGLAVDGQLRVIRSDGAPIPNLYAAGEVIGAGATSGNAYTNGSGVTPAITFGRLLGQRIISLDQEV
jgi:fumarate reductase flavoprotein subunit